MDGQNFNNNYSGQQPSQTPEQSNYQQPNYQQPGYQQPNYQQPGYQQQGYQQPNYQQGYQQPYQQTGYEQNAYQQMPDQNMYQQPYAVPMQTTGGTSGLSIAGFVIAILALLSSCILSWISALIGIVGLIFSIIGQVKKKSGLGIAAIIVSAISIVVAIVFFCVYLNVVINDPSFYRYF